MRFFNLLIIYSGSGKSTIVSLIERFFDVTKGEILLDGHDVRKLSSNYRTGIGYVCNIKFKLFSAQDPLLFSGTI